VTATPPAIFGILNQDNSLNAEANAATRGLVADFRDWRWSAGCGAPFRFDRRYVSASFPIALK